MNPAKHIAYDAARYTDPVWRASKLAQNAAYKASTRGILAQEKHYQKRVRGTSQSGKQE